MQFLLRGILYSIKVHRCNSVGKRFLATAAAESTAKRAKGDTVAKARTRFAPSPTGFMHLGSLRTALYNYLLSKGTGGNFILRIEDTDMKRTVPGAEAQIMETLKWAGLHVDEGPDIGGEFGPYRQSERSDLYRTHAHQLLEKGEAYRCFCTEERLRELALRRGQTGGATDYDRTCASISRSESDQRAAKGEQHVIRLKAPESYPTHVDQVYGKFRPKRVAFQHGEPSFEDPILLKSDGNATYHLANVVDDHLMEITHVIRGNEWLISTPKHIHLYKVFGWKPPLFAHVGLLLDRTGQKLSKRDNAAHISSYKEQGYTPTVLLNFLALMGCHNPRKSDVLDMNGLMEIFDIKHLSKGGTQVDSKKLDFIQRQHNLLAASKKGPEAEDYMSQFVPLVQEELKRQGVTLLPDADSPEYIIRVLTVGVERLSSIPTFIRNHDYFFSGKVGFLPGALEGLKSNDESVLGLSEEQRKAVIAAIGSVASENWNSTALRDTLQSVTGPKPGSAWLHRFLRVALAGGKSGHSLSAIMDIIGKDETLQRITNCPV